MGPDMEEQERLRELFGYGRAGEPVPQVDPSDLKALWTLYEESRKRNPKGGVMIGRSLMQDLCKPGADVTAISYRATKLELFRHILPDTIEPLIQDKLDAVLKAASEIPMVWIGATVYHGWTFDPEDFVRRVREGG
jgi:hypothetical protein